MKAKGNHSFRDYVNPFLGDVLRSIKLDKSFCRANGTVVRDETGREYLDFVAGYGAVPFGHNPDEIWAAVLRQHQASEPGIIQLS